MEDTKTHILNISEQLFAEQGYASTSLRTIVAKAKVNLAAVSYHFGSKENLILEVYRRRLTPLNQKRLELLQELETSAGDTAIPLKKLIEALIKPVIELKGKSGKQGQHIIRLMSHVHYERNEKLQALIIDEFSEVVEQFMKAFKRSLPNKSVEDLFWCLRFLIGAMAFSLNDLKMPASFKIKNNAEDLDQLTERLIAFAEAGFVSEVF